MKKYLILAAALLSVCCSRHETYTRSRTIEDGGSGDFPALMTEEPTLAAHTVFRPLDLAAFRSNRRLPVLVWGNGACANSPWEHVNFLNEIASHGYLVVATGVFPEDSTRYVGPMSTSDQQLEAIDWVFKVNEDRRSPFWHKIDTDAICLAGMSCGGLQALYNSADPRISSLMICNSGLFIDPTSAIPGMPMPHKEQLKEIHTPVIYILGGEEDIAYNNGMDDFSRIDHVPAMAVNYPVGHGGTYGDWHGGEFAYVATAWLQWQLRGDEDASRVFLGQPCGLDERDGWLIERNGLWTAR